MANRGRFGRVLRRGNRKNADRNQRPVDPVANGNADRNQRPEGHVYPRSLTKQDGVLTYSNGVVRPPHVKVVRTATNLSRPQRFEPVTAGVTGASNPSADFGVNAGANLGAGIASAGVSLENSALIMSRSIDHFTYTFGNKATSVGKTIKSFVGGLTVALLVMAVLVYSATIFCAVLYCLAKPDSLLAKPDSLTVMQGFALAVLLPILVTGSASVCTWLVLQVFYMGTSRRGAVY